MSGNGRNGRSGSDSNTPNSGEPQPSAGSASSTVRDFVYLDEAKIFSYLAQIEGGLRLVRQEVESALDTSSTESGGDTKGGSHNFEGQISPAAAALAQALTVFLSAGTPTGLLTGAGGKYTYQREWEKSTDVLKTEVRNMTSAADVTVLHHAAFDLVAERMGDKLVKVEGKMSLLPLKVLENVFQTLNDSASDNAILQAFRAIGDLGVSNVCYVENGRENIHAFLNERHFLVSPAELLAAYGSPSEVDFTIVGLHAQRPGRANKLTSPKQVPEEAKGLFQGINEMLDGLWAPLGVNSARRLYPLAVYLEMQV